jgi:hypothetical protein
VTKAIEAIKRMEAMNTIVLTLQNLISLFSFNFVEAQKSFADYPSASDSYLNLFGRSARRSTQKFDYFSEMLNLCLLNEGVFNSVQTRFYRKPKRFGGLKVLMINPKLEE